MKALLLIAHGSRKKESNEEVIHLASALNQRKDTPWKVVDCAFNQFSDPTPEDRIKALLDQGAREIVVLPYFIAAGSHVTTDIPELVDKARKTYPGVRFEISPHFGAFKGVLDTIVSELSP